MRQFPQKSIKLTKSIIQNKGKASNKIIIISPGKIIYNKEFKITKITNIKHTSPKLIKKTVKNNQEIELDLTQQLRLLVPRLKMNFQKLQITLTLQILATVITHKKKSFFRLKYKLQLPILNSTLFKVLEVNNNCTKIMINKPKKI